MNRLAAYGSHLLGDGSAGDDVAQSTLLKAYTALRAGRVPEKMRPWLYRVAHNVALDLVARRWELPAATLPERASPQGETSAGALVEALAALPERQRRVYVLRELHGLRIDETAAELGLTAPQVEQALFAARNRLAEHLVFGDRLDCVTVRRLAAGPLAADERRALKTHLRSCPDCRATADLRTRVLSAFPAVSATWLRGLATGIGTGGAPVAVKLSAVAATAGLAVGLPSAAEFTDAASRPLQVHVLRPKPAAAYVNKRVTQTPRIQVQAAVPTLTPSVRRVESHVRRHAADGRSSSSGSDDPIATRTDGGRDGSGEAAVATTPSNEGPGNATDTPVGTTQVTTSTSGDGDAPSGHAGGSGEQTVTTTTTQAPTVTASSGDGKDGGSSGDGGGGSGSPDGSDSHGHG